MPFRDSASLQRVLIDILLILITTMIVGFGIFEYQKIMYESRMMDLGNRPSFAQSGKSTFSFDSVQVGDIIKGMKAEFASRTQASASIAFSGKAEISGNYSYESEENPFTGGQVCFWPDEKSMKYIPKATDDLRDVWFCFDNKAEAQKAFSPTGSRGTAKIIIDEYKIKYAPTEIWNTAVLDTVVTKN